MKINCNDCKWINITEENQKKYDKHRCKYYKSRLYHFSEHPRILPCLDCDLENNIHYELSQTK